MDIFSITRQLAFWFRQRPVEPDHVLDARIRDALYEDVDVPIPTGAWERLRRVIIERKPVRSRGMWVLDEPFRDPPESPPTLLTQQQFEQAHRIYIEKRYGASSRVVWESLRIPFSVIVSF
jgi:hypothetical protein